MWRYKKNDPDYVWRKLIRIPLDFYETISRLTVCNHEDEWRINAEDYYETCLAKAKANPLLIWDLTII